MPVPPPARGGRATPGRRHRRRGPARSWEQRWPTSACPRWARTWTAGTIVEWLVAPGDVVHRGDIVAVVDTDKSAIDVECFDSGVVDELLVDVGTEVAVGTPLAHIGALTGAVGSPERRPPPATVAPRLALSPLARRRTLELGADPSALVGSGPAGAIRARDVGPHAVEGRKGPPDLTAAPWPEPVERPQPEPTEAPDRTQTMRSAIGALMARSSREIPHYHLATTIDLGRTVAWLDATNARRSVAERVVTAAVLLTATARAARDCPMLNGSWHDGFEAATGVHLGVAVSLRGGGLIAPAIHDADRLSIPQMMEALQDLVQRARAGRLRASEMSDGTITVTNLGDQGADEVHGVIYPPQVALVGFGRVVDRPWCENGMLGIRPTVRVTLAADHRASDGHDGSKLLSAIDRLLQDPEQMA